MTTFYFTATGNSLYVAKTIGGKLYSIPQLIKNKQFSFEDEIIGFVFPIYNFGLPKIVKEFLENINFKSNYTFAIGTYGNMHCSCMNNMVRYFKSKGWELNYADTILMVDNFLPMFEMSEQLKTSKDKRIEENLKTITENINSKKYNIPNTTIIERIFTKLLSKSPSGKTAQQYIVNEKCNNCRTCINVCPTGNIEIKEKIIFENACESCYACVHICPQNAIHLKNEKSNIRFRNENISIQEIIQANNRK